MSGLKDLKVGVGIIKLPGYGWDSAPEVPEASPIQTTLPTSAYGQTMPVVWGKCRLPAAYIWVPPIATVTSTHTEWWDQITTTTSFMSCRLRFARPLVPNSTWTLRKLYCNGTLIYDASQNYRQKGLKFRAYDGRSTQGRDPTMTKEEGTTNVSAHRGYLDIVLTDFDIQPFGSPPTFEGEWIQDGGSTVQLQNFQTYSGSIFFDDMVPVWSQQKLYGYNWGGGVFLYSIPAARQYFSFAVIDPDNYYQDFRYSSALDRFVFFGSFAGFGGYTAYMFDGSNGEYVATSSDAAPKSVASCLVDVSTTSALFIGLSSGQQIYSFLLQQETIGKVFASGSGWLGYSDFQCITPGSVSGDRLTVYICADNDLVSATFTSTGLLIGSAVVASFADALRYAVYDGGDIVVWTDSATVARVDGATGSIEYTRSVPYQVEDIGTRRVGSPDLQRLTEELLFLNFTADRSYFTDLGTGVTRSVDGELSNSSYYLYDGQTGTVIAKTVTNDPKSLRFIAGEGEDRLLSNFLTDLMVYGGGYGSSQIATQNVDDLIQGGVVDITAGARDIARAVCDPYSIAIFERSGQIVFKRALTDGSFAVDQVISAAGDILDQ